MGSELELLEKLPLADSRYRGLAKHVARTFYAGPCPPADWEERSGGATSSKKKVDTTGLAVVVVDALTQYQWVKEDDLAAKLGINQKTMRRAMVYLADELLIRRESHREHKRRERKDAAPALPSDAPYVPAPGDEEDKEIEEARVQRTYGWVSLDYPRLHDVVRLRLHMLRDRLRRELEGGEAVQQYQCLSPYCRRIYTSMDILNLIASVEDMSSGQLQCEVCQGEVRQVNAVTGQAVNMDQQHERKKALSSLRSRLERELRPVMDLLQQLRDVGAPFFGSLAQWQQSLKVRFKNEQRMAAAKTEAGTAGPRTGAGSGWNGLAAVGGRPSAPEVTIDGTLAAVTQVQVKLDTGAESAAVAGSHKSAMPWLCQPAATQVAPAAKQAPAEKAGTGESSKYAWMDDIAAFFSQPKEESYAGVQVPALNKEDDGAGPVAKRIKVEHATAASAAASLALAAPAPVPAAPTTAASLDAAAAAFVNSATSPMKEVVQGAPSVMGMADGEDEWEDVILDQRSAAAAPAAASTAAATTSDIFKEVDGDEEWEDV